jgi:polyisoprenoid-binding protein YceI
VPIYKVDAASSRIVVKARSSIHDTSTTWNRIEGTAEADPAALLDARASFSVDMTAFDAGDWLKNRKLRKDLDVARHPRAIFEITGLRDMHQNEDGSFRATADGILRWRGKELALAVSGRGRIDATAIDATGSFDLDIRQLGVEPPRFLMFKVESEVTVEVTLRARA